MLAAKARPTIVFADDFLFWFTYGALGADRKAIAEEPVEADLIVEGVPGADPAAEAARARLRAKAQAAKDAFRS